MNIFCTSLLVIYKGKIRDFKVYEILKNDEKQYVEDGEDCIKRDSVNIEWI